MIQTAINAINSFLYNRLLIILLIGAGLYFTIRTKLPQIRLFGEASVPSWKSLRIKRRCPRSRH